MRLRTNYRTKAADFVSMGNGHHSAKVNSIAVDGYDGPPSMEEITAYE